MVVVVVVACRGSAAWGGPMSAAIGMVLARLLRWRVSQIKTVFAPSFFDDLQIYDVPGRVRSELAPQCQPHARAAQSLPHTSGDPCGRPDPTSGKSNHRSSFARALLKPLQTHMTPPQPARDQRGTRQRPPRSSKPPRTSHSSRQISSQIGRRHRACSQPTALHGPLIARQYYSSPLGGILGPQMPLP